MYGIFSYIWGVNVGKYSSTMEHLGIETSRKSPQILIPQIPPTDSPNELSTARTRRRSSNAVQAWDWERIGEMRIVSCYGHWNQIRRIVASNAPMYGTSIGKHRLVFHGNLKQQSWDLSETAETGTLGSKLFTERGPFLRWNVEPNHYWVWVPTIAWSRSG